MGNAEFDAACRERSSYMLFVADQVRFSDLVVLNHVSSVRVNEYFAGADQPVPACHIRRNFLTAT